MKNIIILLTAFITGLSACKKDSTGKVQVQETSKTFAERSLNIAGPENPLNAYDSIGYWHNIILAYVQSCKPETDTPDVEASTGCVLKFYREQSLEIPVPFSSTVKQTVDDRDNDFSNVIANCPYTDTVKAALDSLIKIVKRLSNDSSGYNAIKDVITGFENGITQDIRFSEKDCQIILKAASVARYSIYYWMNINPPPAAAFKLKNIIKWIAAVTSDIGGAIVSGDAGYAADCSSYAYDLVTYSMP